MERLTTKISNCFGNGYKLNVYNSNVALKLGLLEDVEEELGIDLITLFKYVDYDKIIKDFVESFRFEEITSPSTIKIKIKKDKSE